MKAILIFFGIIGIVLLALAVFLFVGSGMALAEERDISGYFAFAGFFLLMGLFCVTVFAFLVGVGEPRDSSDMELNQIYEIVGNVPAEENKVIIVAREQNGKIRIFKFSKDQASDAKFIKVVKNDEGKKEFQPFPPCAAVSAPEAAETPEKSEVPEKA